MRSATLNRVMGWNILRTAAYVRRQKKTVSVAVDSRAFCWLSINLEKTIHRYEMTREGRYHEPARKRKIEVCLCQGSAAIITVFPSKIHSRDASRKLVSPRSALTRKLLDVQKVF